MVFVVGLSHQDGGLSTRSKPDLKLLEYRKQRRFSSVCIPHMFPVKVTHCDDRLTYSGLELSLACKETALSLGIGGGGRGLVGV